MSEKSAAHTGQQPRTLSASEIRSRVEEIAEELALKLREAQPTGEHGEHDERGEQTRLEAYPLDTRKFVKLMSGFIRMN